MTVAGTGLSRTQDRQPKCSRYRLSEVRPARYRAAVMVAAMSGLTRPSTLNAGRSVKDCYIPFCGRSLDMAYS